MEIKQEKIVPACPYFGMCGGCAFQEIPYELQIKQKEDLLASLFNQPIKVLPAQETFSYRNRVDIPVTTQGIGFRKKGTWKWIVPIEDCKIYGEESKTAITNLKRFMTDFNLEPYDIRKQTGFIRYLVLRKAVFTNKQMITIVTKEGSLPDEVEKYFPEVNSIYWCINDSKGDTSIGQPRKYWGEEYLQEQFDETTYFIHPNSFFQTNSHQARELVRYLSSLVEGKNILDLYCGIGTFGLYLAKKGFQVKGIENNPFSVEIANINAKNNSLNAEFIVQEDRKVLSVSGYDTVILDPPRCGLHPKLTETILRDLPNTIIYVSCNPETLKRDINQLSKSYQPISFNAFDLFPHTPHVETVVKLKRIN